MDEGAGVSHHVWGGQHAPWTRQLQGQAAAVQAGLQVQAQWDLRMGQMPCQHLQGKVYIREAQTQVSFLLWVLSGEQITPGSRGQQVPITLPFQRDGLAFPLPSVQS